jgi:hypothetical protein
MTLLFCDSFDHYAQADFNSKWTAASGTLGSNTTINASNGRRSTSSLRISGGQGCVKGGLTPSASMVLGFAYKNSSLPASDTVLATFIDPSVSASAGAHITIALSTTGNIKAFRGSSAGTLLGTSSSALAINTYYYIEIKILIHDSTGTVEVRVNGSNTGWLNLTGQDTRNAGNATISAILILGNATADFDDLYVLNTSGSINNDFLGDTRVDAILPSANGNSSGMTGSDGNSTDNYLLVDEAAANGDTDYVGSATATTKDTYTFPNLSHTPLTISAVQINMWAKKDDAGARSICSVTRSNSADTDGTTLAIGTAYENHRQVVETDPNTAAAWDLTGFNAAEFGVKVAA